MPGKGLPRGKFGAFRRRPGGRSLGGMDEHLVLERDFDAPPQALWRAFTDPRSLAGWFGPEGWSVAEETVRVEARPGGEWHLEMASDDDPAQRSPVTARLGEVEEPRLLVGHTEATEESGGRAMVLRVALAELDGGRTRLTLTQGPYAADLLPMAGEGWMSSFAKLDRRLAAG